MICLNFRQPVIAVLLALGIFVITIAVTLTAIASQTSVVAVNDNLSQYWRTTYDILVRPSNSRTQIEEKYGLVESNYLAGISGGITFDQYETIRGIPGVEIAAPVATLANIRAELVNPLVQGTDPEAPFQVLSVPHEPGVFVITRIIEIDDGINKRREENITYVYNDPSEERDTLANGVIQVNPSGTMFAGVRAPILLLGAIDPVQEAALVNLDEAVTKGEYLTGNELLNIGVYTFEDPPKPQVDDLPILVNARPYDQFTQYNQITRIFLPDEVADLAAILEKGGAAYLDTLPKELIAEQTLNSEALYSHYIERLFRNERELPAWITFEAAPRTYHESQASFPYPYLVLSARLETSRDDFPAVFTMKAKGVYDIEQIPRPTDVNRVPLEIYFPPVATLLYDDTGTPVEPKTYRPSTIADYYIPSPPLLLTTMEGARALRGEDAISAIRVRVDGIEELTPAAQRKIETIAGEIARLTGLDVDIMVGSSPTRMLVHVPGVGYVEEQWIQKNVTATYAERVQTGHLLLLATLLGIGGLFVLDLAWADVVARRRTIALQKALGWRSATVFRQVLGQILLASVVATILSTLVAVGISRLAGWPMPSLSLLLGVPLLVMWLGLAGGAYPAWLAAHIPPIVGLQQGGLRVAAAKRTPLPTRSLWRFAWRGLSRRWSRSALGALTATLSAALLVLMLAVTVDRQGAMSGTLLGEFILVQIEGFHYAIVGIGFGLAALSLANSLLAGVLERRREIGVLKAVGWQTRTVTWLFLAEGVWLGLLGGLAGALVGLAIFIALYESASTSLVWIGLVGILTPTLVGMLAALYPARVAAHVPPAEAVRYE